jgi:hypothetical protein
LKQWHALLESGIVSQSMIMTDMNKQIATWKRC